MAIEKFKKQSYEEFSIGGDFSANFDDGTIISSQTVTATDVSGTDVSTEVLDQSTISNDGASMVNVLVRAGEEANQPYKITFRCVDSMGYKWELDVKMEVKEI